MDRDQKRKLVLIVGAILVVVVAVVLTIMAFSGKKSGETDIITTTDPDTGDEVITVPGKDPEYNPTPGPTIFGGGTLVDKTVITDAQYEEIVRIMSDYATQKVGKDVKAVKFLPETIQTKKMTSAGVPYEYGVQVKTENPETTLGVTISLVGLDRVQLFIVYPDKPELGTFDSGVQPAYGNDGFDDSGDE